MSTELNIRTADAAKIGEMTYFFKMLGDVTRIRIIRSLMDEELRVCDIAERLEMTSSAISHQLRLLKQAKIVEGRRSGKEIFYSIDGSHIGTILSLTLKQIEEDK